MEHTFGRDRGAAAADPLGRVGIAVVEREVGAADVHPQPVPRRDRRRHGPEVDLELAESIADYLASLLEASEGDAGIDAKPEISVGGDHSMTKYNAKQAAVASNNTGDWKDAAPVSDGKDYDKGHADEMGGNGFSNIASGDTWPDMKNPYVPKSMMYKMKEKSAIDDSDDLGTMSSGDTWPNLRNPMALKPVMPKPVV